METHFLTYPLGESEIRGESVVLALGVFDGVHLGHRAVIERAIAIGQVRGVPPAVLTFVEHPRTVMRPDQPVPLLTTWREKRSRIVDLGVKCVVGAHFTPQLSTLPAADFVRQVLVDQLHAAHLVVGYNFRFGHHAAGGPDLLQEMAGELGYGVEVVPPYTQDGQPVSSSEIRHFLAIGQIEVANQMLGYSYELSGLVVGGDQRGRRIGFPTANLHVDERKLLPAFGVYAGHARWAGQERAFVANLGIRPTFDPPQLRVEAHLLDFSGDLYGQQMTLAVERHLRPEQAFPSLEDLTRQIQLDVRQARELLVASEAK